MSAPPKYTKEEMQRAVEYLIAHRRNYSETIRQLGYPASRGALRKWYLAYQKENNITAHYVGRSPYSIEEREYAVKYYVEHHVSVKQAIRDLGYPAQGVMYEWIKADAPDVFYTRACRNNGRLLKCSLGEISEAVIELCQSQDPDSVASKYGVSNDTLYSWKKHFLADNEKSALLMAVTDGKQTKAFLKYLTKDRSELLATKEALARQVENLQDEVYRLRMERDALVVAGEILKKGQGISLTKLRNREKAIAIDALKEKYRLKDILVLFHMAKSSYFYHKKAIDVPDKYHDLSQIIKTEFENARSRYGYRRIHAVLKNSGIVVSEKVIRRLMKQHNLIAISPKKRHYNSYMGEISAATPNLVNRDFHAEKPNMKWLTDITEFSIPAGKVYLSPMIDCFDGMAVSWAIGTSPDSKLVGRMLEDAVSKLGKNDHPIVHSDRGNHYRWPSWINTVEACGLTRSMSKKGCSPDNAACEGFFGRLKNEMFYCRAWNGVSIDEFMNEVNTYIHWYNEDRIKLSLGAKSPVQYRNDLGLAV